MSLDFEDACILRSSTPKEVAGLIRYLRDRSNNDKSIQGLIIECYAPWCGWCKKTIPHVNELADTYSIYNGVPCLIVDMSTDEDLIEQWKELPETSEMVVQGFPTIFIVNQQGEISKYQGERTPEAMMASFLTGNYVVSESDFVRLVSQVS